VSRMACAAAVLAVLAAAPVCAQGRRAEGFGGAGLLGVFDTNRDGVIDKDEIAGAAVALKALDKNGDGTIGADELQGLGRGGPPQGRRAAPAGAGGEAAMFEKPLVPKDEAEKKIVEAIRVMQAGPRYANVPDKHGRFLRLLAEALDAKRIVEIGTSTGESAVWFALALRKTGGTLMTHEIDHGRAELARANFKKAGVADLITIIEGDAHQTVQEHEDPIDILFLDADKQGYLDYIRKLLPLVRPGGLIVAHNMSVRQADPRYVEFITADPNLETTFLFMDEGGVGVTMKKR